MKPPASRIPPAPCGEHVFFIALFLTLAALGFLFHHPQPSGLQPQPSSSPLPVTTPQEYYEAERRRAQHELDEDPFLETPAEKRDRIRARDEAALLSHLQPEKEN